MKRSNRTNGPQPPSRRDFDKAALSNLTRNIDKKLNQASSGSESQKKRKHGRAQGEPPQDGPQKNRKRPRPGADARDPVLSKKTSEDPKATLLNEILALSGDEQDLELVGDIDSEIDEVQNDEPPQADKTLRSELAVYAAELGLNDAEPEPADDESEDAEDVARNGYSESDGEDIESGLPPGAHKKLVFKPRADWHAARLPSLPEAPPTMSKGLDSAMTQLKTHAWDLLNKDAEEYNRSVLGSSSRNFISTIMTSGTLSDKVSALTLAVQESPVHNVKAFESLFNLASKRSRGQALGALSAVVDLLGPGLVLPPDRRLRAFHMQPGLFGFRQGKDAMAWRPGSPLPGSVTEAHLIAWIYENWLKDAYFKVIQLLEVWCADEIEYSRMRALEFVFGLLKDKPEQEANLLRLMVNKLGDRERKISSKASYLLLQLQNTHPGMKSVIVDAIDKEVLQRPGQSQRARYSAVNTLNQTILTSKDLEMAETLLRIYFDVFLALLKAGHLGHTGSEPPEASAPNGQHLRAIKATKGKPRHDSHDEELVDKLVSAVLTGINRAAPFTIGSDSILDSKMDTLFRVAHSANFGTSVHSLMLIQQLSTTRLTYMDRFYRILYESLLDPRLASSSKKALYLNLLLRALKNDSDSRRVKAFVKRMFQILHLHQPSFSCGLLYVINQLPSAVTDLVTLPEELEEHGEGDPGHEANTQDGSNEARSVMALIGTYDGKKRSPEHSNAHHSCLWEMVPVLTHYHPSISVSASAILQQDQQTPKPDLDAFTLIRFLDKFAYRNPKAPAAGRGASIMQTVDTGVDIGNMWLGGNKSSRKQKAKPAINSSDFWNQKVEDVSAEDVFFHEYFKQAHKQGQEDKARRTMPQAEAGTEEEVWEALTGSAENGVPSISDSDEEGLDDLEDGLDDISWDDESDASMAGLIDEEASEDGGSDGGFSESDQDQDGTEGPDHHAIIRSGSGLRKNTGSFSAKKKALRDAPTFASAEDYAELLDEEAEF